MATSKTLAPTNVTISIPAMTDAPNASVLANCADKEADAINALNSQMTNNFPVLKTVAYSQAIGANSSATIAVDTTTGTYMVFVARPDKCKTGVFITDAYGTTELAYCGANVSLDSTTSNIVVVNNNVFTMYATVYKVCA